MRVPGVTVVIPTRDRPALLRQAVDSVAAQDYPGVVRTVVVVDAGGVSADAVARDGGPRPVDVVANERSPGLAGSRNTGVLRADTPLVAFCDDDDVWEPAKLTRQVEALDRHPDAVVASTGVRIRNVAAGTSTDRVTSTPTVTFADLLRDRHAEIHSSTLLFRAEHLKGRLGLVDESVPGSFGEDYDLLLRAARLAPIVAVQQVLVEVRWHGGSFFFERWPTMKTALIWLLETYPEFRTQPKGYSRVCGQIAIATAAVGDRRGALRWALRTLRYNPLERRAAVSVAVAARLVTAEQVMGWLNERGKGI